MPLILTSRRRGRGSRPSRFMGRSRTRVHRSSRSRTRRHSCVVPAGPWRVPLALSFGGFGTTRGRLAGRGVPPALPSPRGWSGLLLRRCGWGLIRGDAGRWSGRRHGVGLGGERRGLRWHRSGGRAPARLRPCRPLRLRDLRFVVPVVVARRVVEEAEWGVAAGIFGSRAVLGRASPRGDEGCELVRGALHRRVLRFPDRCFMNDARYAGSVTVIGSGGSVVVARRDGSLRQPRVNDHQFKAYVLT